MPTFIGGLPLHALVVHAVVVFVPLAALGALVVVAWPAARRRYGVLAVATAAVAAVSTFVAEQAGEALEHLIPRDQAIEAHTSIGGLLKFWTLPLLIVLAAFVLLHRHADRMVRREGPGATTAPARSGSGRRVIAWGLAAVTAVVAVGATVTVVQIGDSGTRAVWGGRVYQEQPRPGAPG